VVTYTPEADYAGTDTFTYTVSDGGLTDTATVAVTVTEVNDPPTITVPYEVYTTDEDVPAVITFTVGDVETPLASLTLAAEASDVNLMANVAFDVGAGGSSTATITPRPDAHGQGVITFTVTDGAGESDSDAFTLTVNPVNDPPTALDDTATVVEDSVANEIDVLANDFTAPDTGETLSIWEVGAAAHGATGFVGDVVTYTPDADYAGADTFTYTVSDGGLTDTATVAVTVTEVNDPPTITVPYEAYTTDEDVPAVITFTVGDVETRLGSLRLAADASNPRLMASVDFGGTEEERTATVTPAPDAYGHGVITFTVSDGELTDRDAFTFTVNPVNDPPVAVDDTATVAEDSVDNEIDVLANDLIAPDAGETLDVAAVGPAQHGTTGLGSGVVIYTPDTDYAGTDVFTYTASDGELTDTATVTVTVTAELESPILSIPGEEYTTDEDVAKVITFTVEDADTALADLDLTAQTSNTTLIPPGNVVFSGSGEDRTATITPALDAYGRTRITFTASDTDGLSDSDTFTLTVAPVNDPPVFDSSPVTWAAVDEQYTYTVSANDPDSDDVLEISAPVLPSCLILTDNGDGTALLSGTPGVADVGDHDVELRVRDSGGFTDTQAFTIVVEPAIRRVYLPLVMRRHVVAPDLIVESLTARSDAVTVTIRNVGSAPIDELFTNEFWVDVYVDPDVAPTGVNQTWEMVGDEGLAWGITLDALPLAPGDALTLTSYDVYYRPDESEISWPIAAGTPIYAQVDSAHVETAHGTVWEIHEIADGTYNNIFGPVAVTSGESGTPSVREAPRPSSESHLPPRPSVAGGSSLVE
jgi:hypothetical protein